jgi:Cysteine-rich CPCC
MNPRYVSCPCCGFWALTERNAFEICPVCFWEDDGQDDWDADDTKGGPNSSSLTEARRNFRAFGSRALTYDGGVAIG